MSQRPLIQSAHIRNVLAPGGRLRALPHIQGEQHQEVIVTHVWGTEDSLFRFRERGLVHVNYRINTDKHSALRLEIGCWVEVIRKASRKR